METPDFRVFHLQRKWEPDFATKKLPGKREEIQIEWISTVAGPALPRFASLPKWAKQNSPLVYKKKDSIDFARFLMQRSCSAKKKKISLDFPDENKGKRNTPQNEHVQWKGTILNGKANVFQPTIFRCRLLVFGVVDNHGWWVPKGSGCGTPSKWPFYDFYGL